MEQKGDGHTMVYMPIARRLNLPRRPLVTTKDYHWDLVPVGVTSRLKMRVAKYLGISVRGDTSRRPYIQLNYKRGEILLM
jgi:hypothetical protein